MLSVAVSWAVCVDGGVSEQLMCVLREAARLLRRRRWQALVSELKANGGGKSCGLQLHKGARSESLSVGGRCFKVGRRVLNNDGTRHAGVRMHASHTRIDACRVNCSECRSWRRCCKPRSEEAWSPSSALH